MVDLYYFRSNILFSSCIFVIKAVGNIEIMFSAQKQSIAVMRRTYFTTNKKETLVFKKIDLPLLNAVLRV